MPDISTETAPPQLPASHPHVDGTKGVCPFAAMAAMAPDAELSNKIYDIGKNLLEVFEYSSDNSHSPLMERYFGSANRHPSFYHEEYRAAEGKKHIRADKLPPYAAVLGDVHSVYRADMIKTLGLDLDVEKLDPDTKILVDDIHSFIKKYRKDVLENPARRFPGIPATWKELPPETLTQYERESEALIDRIKHSRLVDETHTIPIKIGNRSIEVKNTGQLGLFALALDAVYTDYNKGPKVLMKYFGVQSQNAHHICHQLTARLKDDPEMKDQLDKAYQASYLKIKYLLKKEAHALQMANLLTTSFTADESGARVSPQYHDKVSPETFSASCAALLQHAGEDPYPPKLENSLECALVLENILKSSKGRKYAEALKPVYDQCLEQADGNRQPISREDAERAWNALAELAELTLPKAPPVILSKISPKNFIGRRLHSAFNKNTMPLMIQASLAGDFLEQELQQSIPGISHAHASACPHAHR